jgi:hypothetical protein
MLEVEAEILEEAIRDQAWEAHVHGLRVDIKTIGNGEHVPVVNRSIYIWGMHDLRLITKETFQRV